MLRALVLCCLFTLITADPLRAEWFLDGTTVGGQDFAYAAASVPDGAGGAIIVWTELRNSSYDVFARRIDHDGNPLWTEGGVTVCNASGEQTNVVAVSDGAGGTIIAWRDSRTGSEDIYAQRVNSAGAPTWTANGVAICTATGVQAATTIASDGASGAIIAWQDARSGTNWDLYARRINSAGTPQWTADGVGVCTLPSGQTGPDCVADGSGGVLLAWSDNRNDPSDIYAQRLNASGAPQWTANGVGVCTATGEQAVIAATPDASGGIILAWYDERAVQKDIFAQRVNGSGVSQWLQNGVAVCVASDEQGSPAIVGDGAGGAVVAWEDVRNGVDVNIFAQRLSASGVAMWDYNGIALCTASGNQSQIALVSDGAGGAIASWNDHRGAGYDVYARRILAHGLAVWEYDGSPLSIAFGDQSGVVAVGDGTGGVIAAWSDFRTGITQVRAQRLEPRYGYWGRPEPGIKPAVDNPADQGGNVIVRWAASQRDLFYLPGITHYSVWRATDEVAFETLLAALGKHAIVDPRAVSREHAGAVVWKEETPAGPVYWEWVANLGATYQSSYSYTAPTRQDSTAADAATHHFKVLAHEIDYPQGRVWESTAVSARSVDNLAPASPLLLAIQAAGPDAVLTWKPVDAADLANYTLYRADGSRVQPIPVNFLIDRTLPNFTDVGAAAGGYYYIVTANDIHGNQSAPSNEVSLQGSTDVGDTPGVTALSVRPNAPNPFSSRTDLNVGLPDDAQVSLELFDIAGRRVLTRSLGRLEKGWQRVSFDAIDDDGRLLANGVYFYRVSSHGKTVTHKMVIAR